MAPTCTSTLPSVITEAKVACHVCGASALRKRFSLRLFDGPYRNHDDARVRMIYECRVCGHLSVDRCDASQFADYYASLPDDYHRAHDNDQSRYEHIVRLIMGESPKKVLDIGCGTGTLLTMLPAQTERFGIEPSRAAAEQARSKGIEIIGYEDLERPELLNSFDLVTVVDVVEHTTNLLELRRYLYSALRPGGKLIILTGDAQSRSARFLGRNWLYLNYAEHVTIFCRRSMETWLLSDFSIIEVEKTDHHPLTIREGLSLIRMWLLFPIKWLVRRILPGRVNFYAALSLPRDHMLVLAVRN